MKKILYVTFLIFSVFLLFSPQPGFAWPTYEGGCMTCHGTGFPALENHTIHQGQACNICHTSPNGGDKPISTSKCIACHPRTGDKGLCPLIDAPVHAGTKQTCLGCHTTCAPATTTTTTPANTTTTTASETTTTTTAPSGCILTIDPAEIEVDGTTDVTQDIKVTIDASGLTEADLEGLVVDFSDACSQSITVNTVNYAIADQKVEGTANITVKGDAPTSECTLTAKNTSGTINCETKFTITSTATPACQIKSITPSTVRVGFGILPRIQRFVFTFNIDVEAQGITPDDIKIDTPNVTIFYAKISGNTITVWAVLRGLKPDSTYYFTVGDCGTYSIDTKGFF
jgi:hypothetical protein